MSTYKLQTRHPNIWKALALTLALSLIATTVALAAAGDLDTTFSKDGKVTTNVGGALRNDYGRAVAIQSDGKIVVVGDHYREWNFSKDNNDFALLRYKVNGSIDTTFSVDGRVTTDVGYFDQAMDVAIQPDGKIVVVGQTCGRGGCSFAIARYNPNGGLDKTFSYDGTTGFGLGNDSGSFGGVAILPSGKILVAGYYYSLAGDYDFVVARFDADGILDYSFNNGFPTVNFGFEAGKNDYAYDMAILPDEKIVIVGKSCDSNDANCDFALARLNPDGTMDNTFSGNGKQVTNFGQNESGNSVALQADGKIIVAGSMSTANDSLIALARYNTKGNLDTTFSGDGKVTKNLVVGEPDYANDVAIQSNGRIVVVGRVGLSGSRDTVVVRFKTNGSLDGSFSGDGKVIVDFGNDDLAMAVALQEDGRIVVVGMYFDGVDWDVAVSRYLP